MKPCASARALLPLAVLFVLAARPAAAQEPGDRHVSVGVAAGLATPFHGDFDFTGTAWQVDAQFGTARFFGFGAFFEEWRHTDEEVFTDQIISGPNGPLAGLREPPSAPTTGRARSVGTCSREGPRRA